MAGDIEDLAKDKAEEIALDEVFDPSSERKKPRWELWVAVSSSMLAVVSVVAALLATFASDEAAVAMSDQTDYSVAADGIDASHTMLKVKLELLASMGKPATESDLAELKRVESQASTLRARSNAATEVSARALKVHDSLAIGVMLFQVTMLLSGVAVMVGRVAIWRFGLVFSAAGLVFFLRGLIGYVG